MGFFLFLLNRSRYNNSRTNRARMSRFHRKYCLINSAHRFRSNVIVWVPNSQQALKQKSCYLDDGSLIKRSHYITFVCMPLRKKRVGCNNPIVLVVENYQRLNTHVAGFTLSLDVFQQWANIDISITLVTVLIPVINYSRGTFFRVFVQSKTVLLYYYFRGITINFW